MLDRTMHKRLASACLHALGALSANNESNRRLITENSSLICRLVDSIQLNRRRRKSAEECGGGGEESDENVEDSDEETSKYAEWEETLRNAEMNGRSPEEVDRILGIHTYITIKLDYKSC